MENTDCLNFKLHTLQVRLLPIIHHVIWQQAQYAGYVKTTQNLVQKKYCLFKIIDQYEKSI